MVKLSLAFAIAGTCVEAYDSRKSHDATITVNPCDVRKYGPRMEEKTGVSVINGFYQKDIVERMDSTPFLRRIPGRTDQEGYPSFQVDMAAMSKMKSWPDVPACVVEYYDPQMNYPMEILVASGLFPALGNEQEPDDGFEFTVLRPMADRNPSEATLRNKYYTATVTYPGDFGADMANGCVDPDDMSAYAHPIDPQDRTLMRLMVSSMSKPEYDGILFQQTRDVPVSEASRLLKKLRI